MFHVETQIKSSAYEAIGCNCRVAVYSEKKKAAHKFVQGNFPWVCEHRFHDVYEHASGKGDCVQCGLFHFIPERQPDVLHLSPACQPFSTARTTTGTTSKTMYSEQHPLYDISMDACLALIQKRRPICFCSRR